MALFMNRADLEAIRPAHVSMGAMWLWYAVRSGIVLSLAGFVAGVLTCFAILVIGTRVPDPLESLIAVAFVGFVLSLLANVPVMVFFFARYSLRTLMLIVLVTACLAALFIVLPKNLILYLILAVIVWWTVLWAMIGSQDPWRHGLVVAPRFGIHSAAKAAVDPEPEE